MRPCVCGHDDSPADHGFQPRTRDRLSAWCPHCRQQPAPDIYIRHRHERKAQKAARIARANARRAVREAQLSRYDQFWGGVRCQMASPAWPSSITPSSSTTQCRPSMSRAS